jgi:hypothetical protein
MNRDFYAPCKRIYSVLGTGNFMLRWTCSATNKVRSNMIESKYTVCDMTIMWKHVCAFICGHDRLLLQYYVTNTDH